MKKYQQRIGIGLIGFRAVLKSPQATEPISIIVVDGDWKLIQARFAENSYNIKKYTWIVGIYTCVKLVLII